jgi:hypothetical protein
MVALAVAVIGTTAFAFAGTAGARPNRHRHHHHPGFGSSAGDDIPFVDIAKFVFEGLRSRANRPECLKTPPAPDCKEEAFGDVLRMFTSPTEKALADISRKLDVISAQLKHLESVLEELRHAIDQNTYNNIVGFMRPEVVQQAMKTFLEVTQRCAKGETAWAGEERRFCETELGNGTRQDPGALRLQIRNALIDSGVLKGMPARVSGANGTTGVLDAWPKVVKDRGDFFTGKSSKTMLDGLDYFYNLELSAITLAVNYWRWEGRSEAAIKEDIDDYQKAVNEQRKVFSPLPPGVFIDVRSGLMWASSVFCATYSRYGPRETNQCPATYAGFPVTDQKLLFPGYPHRPGFTNCQNGSWCMGTKEGMEKLLRGATTPWVTWLKNRAGVEFKVAGEADTWLVDVICDNGDGVEWGYSEGRILCFTRRYYVNWDRSFIGTSYLPEHNAAYYIFVRRPTEQNRYY